MKKIIYSLLLVTVIISSCKKDPDPVPENPPQPRLIFKFKFDSTQVRLDNLGQPSTLPSGNRAQSPIFNKMSAHYIELAQGDLTPLGGGVVLYTAPQTTSGGPNAIDFSQAVLAGNNQEFFSIPLSQVAAGNYKWLRVSLAYQNYDIKFKEASYVGMGTIASFLGFNTYISNYVIKTQSITVNDDKAQGYWGFEAFIPFFGYFTTTGQAPSGATTVVNPIQSTSPIPAGSCVVTGQFVDGAFNLSNLNITGNETSDIVITVSLSTNGSFEWIENGSDNFYEPNAGDTVVDMGVRGMIPIKNN